MFGGKEEVFMSTGFTEFYYVAAVKLGSNPALLLDTVGGSGYWAVERAGYVGYHDLAVAWKYILLHFENLPAKCVLHLVRVPDELEWKVKEVEEVI
jgi:hypothetical protein